MDLRYKLDFHLIDFHLHTNKSPCGSIPLQQVIEESEKRGLLCIALTDHWKEDTDLNIFREEREEIDRANTDLKIFLSAEVEVLNDRGKTPVNPKVHREILEKMDYLSAAPHMEEKDIPMENKRKIIEYAHRKHMNILKNNIFQFVLHPWVIALRKLVFWQHSRVPSFEDVPESYLQEFAESAAFHNKGIEIHNVSAAIPVEGYGFFVEKLIKVGVKIAVGSDTHHKRNSGKTDQAIKIIKLGGGDKSSLWFPQNYSLDSFKDNMDSLKRVKN